MEVIFLLPHFFLQVFYTLVVLFYNLQMISLVEYLQQSRVWTVLVCYIDLQYICIFKYTNTWWSIELISL